MSAQSYMKWIGATYPGYVGNWPPNNPLSVGSIGTIEATGFLQRSSLSIFAQEGASSPVSQDYGTTIDSGTPPSAALTISFSDLEGFVVQATGVNMKTVSELGSVKETVRSKIDAEEWSPDWYVVVAVELAAVATIIVPTQAGSKVILNGTAGKPLALAGDARLMQASRSDGGAIVHLALSYPVLMYRAMKVSDAWWRLSAKPAAGAARRAGWAQKPTTLPDMAELKLSDVLSKIQF
jgi:hypothetical protein